MLRPCTRACHARWHGHQCAWRRRLGRAVLRGVGRGAEGRRGRGRGSARGSVGDAHLGSRGRPSLAPVGVRRPSFAGVRGVVWCSVVHTCARERGVGGEGGVRGGVAQGFRAGQAPARRRWQALAFQQLRAQPSAFFAQLVFVVTCERDRARTAYQPNLLSILKTLPHESVIP